MTSTSKRLPVLFALLGGLLAVAPAARANDGIFPPNPAIKSVIDFDGRGFLIGGKRTFLTSGSLHYARVPRALWRDRLLRFKRAGFNTVQSYVFWNAQEPKEGQFDFTDNKDLDAFLKLVKEMGMYAVVRVGPYVCAEWDSGGYPIWLKFKPGVRVREDNPEFEAAVDKYLDKVFPIVAANQIHRGGAVIMVQLENEHPQAWGTDMPNNYFKHLKEKADGAGIEVPTFFSGLHHGSDPAGGKPWDSAGRTNPWYTTEFWPGWYDLYGPLSDGNFRRFDRGTWKILAYGGNGYNYYMLHGGTNFDYLNNNEDASSYDYAAAVGQAGDLRPIYYRFKRAAWFARSFQSVLENSENATDSYQDAVTNSAVRVTARRSPAGTILFLDNPGNDPAEIQVKTGDSGTPSLPESGTLTLAPGEIMPVVRDYALSKSVTLQWAPTRILGIADQGDVTTLVIYGPTGSPAELRMAVPSDTVVNKGEPDLALTMSGQLNLKAHFPAGNPTEYAFTAGGHRYRILAVSDLLADYTWFVDAGGQSYVVCGPDYVADADVKGNRLRLVAEEPWNTAGAASASVAYGPGDTPQTLSANVPRPSATQPPALGTWEMKSASAPAEPAFNDRAWKTTQGNPPQMGEDGDITADAWYRTTLSVPTAGTYTLSFNARDRASLYLDGHRVPAASVHTTGATLNLSAGSHALAVFVAHDGRDKLFGYLGSITNRDPKGLAGTVALRQPDKDAVAVTGWRMQPITERPERTPPAADAPGWTDVAVGANVFDGRRGYAWFQTTLPTLPNGALNVVHRAIHFESVDDNATVFLNGKQIGRHEGWDESFDVPIASAWNADGPNILTIRIQNTDGAGGLMGAVSLLSYRYDAPITSWKLRGGPGDGLTNTGWTALAGKTPPAGPVFYRTHFTTTPPGATGTHPILRISLKGLGHGSVWLNGHNLGRYPEKVPVDGIYLPECWLNKGANTLVVFDEDGSRPDAAALTIETAASRVAEELWTP